MPSAQLILALVIELQSAPMNKQITRVGGGRGAGIHSTTRVNGFLEIQSEGIYTAAQKYCGMAGGGRYPHILRSRGVYKPSKRVWSTRKKYD
jgi:hypothetical protein